MNDERKADEQQDRTVEDSFPASDPPSTTPVSGTRAKGGKRETVLGGEDHRAKGTPTDDRLQSETASARQQGIHPPQSNGR